MSILCEGVYTRRYERTFGADERVDVDSRNGRIEEIKVNDDGTQMATIAVPVVITTTLDQISEKVASDVLHLCSNMPSVDDVERKPEETEYHVDENIYGEITLVINNGLMHVFGLCRLFFIRYECVSLYLAMREHKDQVWLRLSHLSEDLRKLPSLMKKYGIITREVQALFQINNFLRFHKFPKPVRAIIQKHSTDVYIDTIAKTIVDELNKARVTNKAPYVLKRVGKRVIEIIEKDAKRQRS